MPLYKVSFSNMPRSTKEGPRDALRTGAPHNRVSVKIEGCDEKFKTQVNGCPKALVHNDRRDICRSGSEARRLKLRYRSPSLANSVT